MIESNSDLLQRELKLRKVRQSGKELLKGQELYDFLGIKEKHDRTRDAADMMYRAEYKLRVSVAYKMLLKRATAKALELKRRFVGRDKLNPKALQHKAEFFVRSEHMNDMTRIDRNELKESVSFMEKSTQRRAYIDAFNASAKQRQKASRATRNHSPTMTD